MNDGLKDGQMVLTKKIIFKKGLRHAVPFNFLLSNVMKTNVRNEGFRQLAGC